MKIKYLTGIAALALAFSARANVSILSEVDSLSLRIAESSISLQSDILSKQAEVEAMRGENRLPDPTVEVESLFHPEGSKFTGSVSQEFELPSVYRARNQAADTNLKAIEQLRLTARHEKAVQAKLLIIDYIYQNRRLVALQKMKSNLDSIAIGIEKGYKGGELTVLDLRKVNIQQADLARTIAETEMSAAEIAGQINALADGKSLPQDITAMLQKFRDYPLTSLKNPEYYEELALTHNPVFQLNAAGTSVAREMEKVAAAEKLPKFGLGYIFNREEGRNYNGFNVSVSLPLWQGNGKRKAAQLEVKSRELQEESARISELANITALYKSALIGEKSLKEKTSALGATSGDNSWLSLLLKSLKAGRISMLEYLNETSYFLNASLELEDARHAQARLMAELEKYSLF